MAEYYNKEYYNQIKGNCAYIDLNPENIKKVMRALYDSGIKFSASYGGYRNTVTVANEDRARAMAIADEYRFGNNRYGDRIIGNIEYGKLRDRNFINTDPATAMQVAYILSGDNSIRYSGRIQADRATITVSGRKNYEMVSRLVDNIRNADIISELEQAGFERLPDSNGTVVIRNVATGEAAGFRTMNNVRDMWSDPNNEFFHAPVYAVDKTVDADNPYYISETDGQTERSVYVDDNMTAPVFAEQQEAESYAAENNIPLAQPEETEPEIKGNPIIDANLDLIEQFDKVGELYPDVIYYDDRDESFTWLHYDEYAAPDGALVEKYITETDVFEAYKESLKADTEEAARNMFISALNERAEKVPILVNDIAFSDSAEAYMNMPVRGEALSVFDINEGSTSVTNLDNFIGYLEKNTAAIREDKARREQEENKAVLISSCYDRLKTAVFENEAVKKAIEGSDFQNAHIESLSVMEKEAMNIFNEDIYGNIDFYADFFGNKMTENRKALEEYITATLRDVFAGKTVEKNTPDSVTLSFGDSKHFTESAELSKFAMEHENISFALGNAIFEYLDEKQHTERDIPELNAGWYDKSDFNISCIINGEEFSYNGRYDIGDGKGTGGGSLIDHIRLFAENVVKTKESYVTDEERAKAQNTLDVLIPFLEKHSELTAEEQQIINEYKTANPIRYTAEQEAPEQTVAPAYRDVPLYTKSILYAKQNNEIELFRKSDDENRECVDCIIDNASKFYSDNRFNSDSALNAVLAVYPKERVEYVVAVNIANMKSDGRISRDNLEWAENYINGLPEEYRKVGSNYITIHAGLLNMFAESTRKYMEQEREVARVSEKVENRIKEVEALRQQFTDKIKSDLDDFLAEPKEDVSEYQVNTKKDFADFIINNDEYDLSETQYKALLSSPDALSEIYNEWLKLDTDEWDEETLTTLISDTADLLVRTSERDNSAHTQDDPALEQAKAHIREYLDNEFDSEETFKNLRSVSIGYTELGDNNEYPFQAEADLVEYNINFYLDNQIFKTLHYDSLEEMNDFLDGLHFDDVVAYGNEELDSRNPDEIAKALDLARNHITFSVIRIEGEEAVVSGRTYLDTEDIQEMDEYQEYILKTGKRYADVTVEYYDIGNDEDFESYPAEDGEADYIQKHLVEVLNHSGCIILETKDFSVQTPDFLLEEYAQENSVFRAAEKNTIQFSVISFGGGLDYYEAGHIKPENLKDTTAYKDMRENLGNVDEVRCDITHYSFGSGEAIPATHDMLVEIEQNFDEVEEEAVVALSEELSVKSDSISVIGRKIDVETAHQMWENGFDVFADGKVIPRYDFKNYDNVIKTSELFKNENTSFSAAAEDIETNSLIDTVAEIAMDFDKTYKSIESVIDGHDWLEWGWEGDAYNRVRNALATGDFRLVNEYFNEVFNTISYKDDEGDKKWFRYDDAFKELKKRLPQYLGRHAADAYYYFPQGLSIHDLWRIRAAGVQDYAIAAPTAALSEDFMQDSNIRFYKIGRDIDSSIDDMQQWQSKRDMVLERHLLEKAKNISREQGKPFAQISYSPDTFKHLSEEDYDLMARLIANDEFKIYQVKSGDEYHFKRFAGLDELEEAPNISDYDLVYTGYLSDFINASNVPDELDSIFAAFNVNRPKDFKGHSMSMSDVLMLHGDTPYYVDSIGFGMLSRDFLEIGKKPETSITIPEMDFSVDFGKGQTVVINEEWETGKHDNIDHFQRTRTFSYEKWLMCEKVSATKNDEYWIPPFEPDTESYDIRLDYIRETIEDALNHPNRFTVEVVDSKEKQTPEKEAEQKAADGKEDELSDINVVTPDILSEVIETREPRSLFIAQEGDRWVGVDNQTGDAWTEDFATRDEAVRWLRGEELDEIDIKRDLSLENTNLKFSVITIDGGKPFVVGGFVEKDEAMALDEVKEYLRNAGKESADVKSVILTLGTNDIKAREPDNTELNYITENLGDVLAYKSIYGPWTAATYTYNLNAADVLPEKETETFGLDTKRFTYVFTEIEYETGEIFHTSGDPFEWNLDRTAGYDDVVKKHVNTSDIDLSQSMDVTMRIYRFGDGDELIPNKENMKIILDNLEKIKAGAKSVDVKEFTHNFWKDVDFALNELYKVAGSAHKRNPEYGKDALENTYLLPADHGEYNPDFNSAVLQIKLPDKEWLSAEEAVKAMQKGRNPLNVRQIEMLNVRTVDSSGQTGEKDMPPELFYILMKRSLENHEQYKAAVKALTGRIERSQSVEKKTDEPYEPKLGDKFIDKRGEEWELTSLTGVLPWYTDQCAIKNISGSIVVEKNESYTNLLDPAKYTRVIDVPEKPEEISLSEKNSEYTPKIGDMIEMNDELLSISDISGNIITFTETESLFGNTSRMTVSDFLSSDFSVYSESDNAISEDNEEITDVDVQEAPMELFGEEETVVLFEDSDEETVVLFEDNEEDTVETAEKETSEIKLEFIVIDLTGNSTRYDRTHSEETAETPAEKPKNFVITDENLGVNTAKARYNANIEAIRTLNAIEAEHRSATPEEQQILSGYTGWGAIPQVFDSANSTWSKEYTELKELLTDDEYNAARRSTMNAHYTSPVVINAIYQGLANLGFEKGKVLEPAMGIGNFFGVMPEAMRGSDLYGVELDSLTGRIAKQLYPNADIQIKGYEQTRFENDSFDVVLGNVPFGDYKLSDREYDKHNFRIHDYFIAKSLDKLRAGGIMAIVTSKGTMDKANSDLRLYAAQRAELLGAIRLPNNAFKANAGTEVTTDILFFQKRDRAIEINPDNVEWLHRAETEDGFEINKYFITHPEMVLGKIVEGNKLYGNQQGDTSCVAIEGADLKQQLAEAVKHIQGHYEAVTHKKAKKQEAEDVIPAPPDSRKFSYYAVDGAVYFREDSETMKKVNLKGETLKKALAMIEIRENVRELLDLQLVNYNGSRNDLIAISRGKLNKRYDAFVAKYGHFDDKKNSRIFKGDDGYNFLVALESKDKDGVYQKTAIFTHDTVKPNNIVTHVDTAEDALILSVAEKAKVDFEYMTELCGMDKEMLIKELEGQIFRLPQEEEKYVTADEYLTGNIRLKLKALDYAPEGMDVSKHREALTAAIPKRIEAKDISVKLGSHWVDPKFVAQFIKEKFSPGWRTHIDVQYSKASGRWKIDGMKPSDKKGYTVTNEYGTRRRNAYDILEGILNHEDLTVKDIKLDEFGNEMRDSKGNYVKVTNPEETKAVQACVRRIEREWQDWIFKDPDRREALVEKYNEIFNSIRHREYDGSHLNFVGMNTEIDLREHQKNAIARALYGGNTLLAHAVGAGKTFEMIAIAMEGKRLGLHSKSLFVVPNALTEQIGKDFLRLYPNANILVATKKDFEPKNRKMLFAKIATGEYDAVIVGHSQFDRMALSPARSEYYLTQEIVALRVQLEMAKKESGEKSFSVKEIEKTIAKYEKSLKEIQGRIAKDDYIDFEQMGFDKLFVDECHLYKNLGTATKMSNVAGIGTHGSSKAAGLLMKSKYFDELTGGKGQVYASGTPIITGYQRSEMPILRCLSKWGCCRMCRNSPIKSVFPFPTVGWI